MDAAGNESERTSVEVRVDTAAPTLSITSPVEDPTDPEQPEEPGSPETPGTPSPEQPSDPDTGGDDGGEGGLPDTGVAALALALGLVVAGLTLRRRGGRYRRV